MRSWRGARVILIGHRLRPCPDTLPRRTVSRTMQRAQPLRRLPASQQTEPSQPTIPRCGAPSSLSPDRQARADLPLTVDAHTPVARHTPSPQGLVLAALRTTWPRPLAEPAAAPCRLRSQLEGHPVDPSPPARPCCAAQGVRDGSGGWGIEDEERSARVGRTVPWGVQANEGAPVARGASGTSLPNQVTQRTAHGGRVPSAVLSAARKTAPGAPARPSPHPVHPEQRALQHLALRVNPQGGQREAAGLGGVAQCVLGERQGDGGAGVVGHER